MFILYDTILQRLQLGYKVNKTASRHIYRNAFLKFTNLKNIFAIEK